MHKPALKSGILFAALAVILGAFGAHAFKKILQPDMLQVFETGVRYQFYHSFALIIAGILFSSYPAKSIKTAVIFFVLGIILFSGSLYAMALASIYGSGLGAIGVVTPIGGLLFIIGWIFLFMGVSKNNHS